jgi:hypothetical protein
MDRQELTEILKNYSQITKHHTQIIEAIQDNYALMTVEVINNLKFGFIADNYTASGANFSATAEAVAAIALVKAFPVIAPQITSNILFKNELGFISIKTITNNAEKILATGKEEITQEDRELLGVILVAHPELQAKFDSVAHQTETTTTPNNLSISEETTTTTTTTTTTETTMEYSSEQVSSESEGFGDDREAIATQLTQAAANGDLQAVENLAAKITNTYSMKFWEPLIEAMKGNHFAVAAYCYEQDQYIDAYDVKLSYKTMQQMINSNYTQLLNTLIQRGAQPNSTWTDVLFAAIEDDKVEIVKIIINNEKVSKEVASQYAKDCCMPNTTAYLNGGDTSIDHYIATIENEDTTIGLTGDHSNTSSDIPS